MQYPLKGSRFYNITKPLNKLTRQLKADNIKVFKNSLSIVNWDYMNSDDNPETSYSNFLNKTTELLNNIHCPLKSIKKKTSNRKNIRKPWVTTSILKSIRTKDKLYKISISKPTTENKLKYTIKIQKYIEQPTPRSKKKKKKKNPILPLNLI